MMPHERVAMDFHAVLLGVGQEGIRLAEIQDPGLPLQRLPLELVLRSDAVELRSDQRGHAGIGKSSLVLFGTIAAGPAPDSL